MPCLTYQIEKIKELHIVELYVVVMKQRIGFLWKQFIMNYEFRGLPCDDKAREMTITDPYKTTC